MAGAAIVAAPEAAEVAPAFLSDAAPKLNFGAVLVAAGALVDGVEAAVDDPKENEGVADAPSAGLLVRIEGV
jgi:hypothetical protein